MKCSRCIFINIGCPVSKVKLRISVVRGQFHTHQTAIYSPGTAEYQGYEKTQISAFTQSFQPSHPHSRNNSQSPTRLCSSLPQLQGDPRSTWSQVSPWVGVGGVCAMQGRVLCTHSPHPWAACGTQGCGLEREGWCLHWWDTPVPLTAGPVFPFPRLMGWDELL